MGDAFPLLAGVGIFSGELQQATVRAVKGVGGYLQELELFPVLNQAWRDFQVFIFLCLLFNEPDLQIQMVFIFSAQFAQLSVKRQLALGQTDGLFGGGVFRVAQADLLLQLGGLALFQLQGFGLGSRQGAARHLLVQFLARFAEGGLILLLNADFRPRQILAAIKGKLLLQAVDLLLGALQLAGVIGLGDGGGFGGGRAFFAKFGQLAVVHGLNSGEVGLQVRQRVGVRAFRPGRGYFFPYGTDSGAFFFLKIGLFYMVSAF